MQPSMANRKNRGTRVIYYQYLEVVAFVPSRIPEDHPKWRLILDSTSNKSLFNQTQILLQYG